MKIERKTLENNFIPKNYNIKIEPNIKKFTYKCDEIVNALVTKKIKEIQMNSAEIKIIEAYINENNTKKYAKIEYDSKNEKVIFKFNDYIKGEVTFYIKFIGNNNDKMHGFYRSAYKYQNKKYYMLTTHMEPVDARRVFVCVDEPDKKATFDVTVIIPKELDAISNMPIKNVRVIDKLRKEIIFNTTLKMATYLLYIGIGRFEYNESRYRNLNFRIITTPNKKDVTEFALESCKKFVNFYERYFGINYPLPKLDLIAVPDFPAGAMENWGAITFREIELFANSNSSVGTKQRVAEVVSHELAHQWFGDLVTMKWWDDLWLNESFAEFMSHKAMDNVFPEWKVMPQYIMDMMSTAFAEDQYKSTHPINVEVANPNQIGSIFDAISYEKGGIFLYMLEDYVGAEIFRKGLHEYLNSHKYSNAVKEDLWQSIQTSINLGNKKKDIIKFSKKWVENTGYPYVIVHRKNDGFILEQKRMFMNKNNESDSIWPIAIKYYLDKKLGVIFLDKKKENFEEFGEVFKLNYKETGLYRVQYDKKTLNNIGKSIQKGNFKELDTWSIINDLFVYAYSNRIKLNEYLDYINKYGFEFDYPANSTVIAHLEMLYKIIKNVYIKDNIQSLISRYCNKIIEELGFETREDDDNITILLRGNALHALALIKDKKIIDYAYKLFEEKYIKNKEIDSNLSRYVYYAVAHTGGVKEYNIILKMYKNSKIEEDKIKLLQSLGMFENEELVVKTLKFALSKEVKPGDINNISMNIGSNIKNHKLLLNWTKSNWKTFKLRYPSGNNMLPRFINSFSLCTDKKIYKEIKLFFNKSENMSDDIKRPFNKLIERIEANIRFIESN
jgi:tricorn protease interacting factor F2/3